VARDEHLRAAGTVILRPAPTRAEPTGPQVLLVHRERYDDWSLPKGKLRPDESWPVAAVRETREETGFPVRLGAPVGSSFYEFEGRPKEVRYWLATATGAQQKRIGDEVDACEWFDPDAALAAVKHDRERELIVAAIGLPPTVALVIARHAKARSRKKWPGEDQNRPLDKRGNDQAGRLAGLLAAWSPGRVISSPSRRCVDSIEPYARHMDSTVDLEPLLSEEEHSRRSGAVAALLGTVVAEVRRDLIQGKGEVDRPSAQADSLGEPSRGVVLCTHRPVLPTIADALRIPLAADDRQEALPTAGCWILHLTAAGVLEIERHRV